MSIHPEVRRALGKGRDQIWARHGKEPNFTGCGIGYRRRGGVVTDEPVVIAMVVDKLPAGALSSRRLIPSSVTVDGTSYGVDVVEAGPVYASGSATSRSPHDIAWETSITDPFRPMVPGCSIGNSDILAYGQTPGQATGPLQSPAPAGTLGCFAQGPSGQVYVVSAGHIMAGGFNNNWDTNTGNRPGSVVQPTTDLGNIVQPALADQSGTGSTYTAPVATADYVSSLDTTPGSLVNTVDCGTAVLKDASNSSTSVAQGLMQPISATHPAVGMCIASDGEGNSFLTRMDSTMQTLGMPFLGAQSDTDWVQAPVVGTNIEKVGRTSAYTSSTVDATDAIVTVNYVDNVVGAKVPVTLSGMIWSQYLSLGGDSGAVACAGGDGHTYVLPPNALCGLMTSVQSYYALPANPADNNLTNKLQSKMLTQTITGNLLIGLVYLNQQTIIDRLNTMTGPDHNQTTAQAFFQQIYDTYRPVLISMLTSPSTFTLTPQMATDGMNAWGMLSKAPADGGQGLLTAQETNAIYNSIVAWLDVIASAGWTYQQMQEWFDTPAWYDGIYQSIVLAPTIVAP